MSERVILDPAEGGSGLYELDISDWIRAEPGPDWGDAAVAAYMADQTYGSAPVDYRVPNRMITLPLVLRTKTGASFDTIRTLVQGKVTRWQQEGGVLKRVTSNGGTVFADIVNASLKEGGAWSQAWKDYDVDAQIELETLPEFYENEIALPDHVETTLPEITFTEVNIKGDYPARVRWVVDEDQGQNQLGLMWCTRARHYSAGTTAAMAYEAELMTPLDTAARAALTGASGGTVVTHGTLSTNWTPVLSTNLPGNTFLTHEGTYRWLARYRTTSGTAVSIRGIYDVGDLVNPTENNAWYHPAGTAGTAFYIADLGEIRLQATGIGVHRWQGQIQGRGVVGSAENLSIDRVWFQCLDESAGMLRAPALITSQGLVTYSARDSFNQSAGTLNGKTAEVGGVWATTLGTAGDFSVNGAGSCTRAAVNDPGGFTGRFAVSGVSGFASQAVQVDITHPQEATASQGGVLARYTDTNNHFKAYIEWFVPGGRRMIAHKATTAGGIVSLMTSTIIPEQVVGTNTRMLAIISAGGGWWVYLGETLQGRLTLVASGWDPDLASTGTLASGKPGFYDSWPSPTASTRVYDNFLAWSPNQDAVAFASQSAQLTTRNGMLREDSTGTAYGPSARVEGDLPRLPISGPEGRTVQVMTKLSRGDFDTQPDTGIDDTSVQGNYRPCWLYVPKTLEIPETIAGLELWLRPEGLPSSGSISSWRDDSGNSRNATASGSGTPTVVTSALDGYSCASFVTDDFLTCTGITASDATRTIIVVARHDGGASTNYFWTLDNINGEACVGASSSTQLIYVRNEAFSTQNLGGATASNWNALTIRYNSTSSVDFFPNGGSATNFDPRNEYSTSGATMILGARLGAQFLNGRIAEVLVYNSALAGTGSSGTLSALLGYISRKYPTLGSFGT